MKAIFKLLILNFLTLFIFPSCSDDDKSKSELNDPISGNISPVGSFAVEATNNENELLVKWTNPSNRDVDMVELSYRDVEASLSRATDFSPGHIIIQVERDVTQEYMLKVPYFATYEVSAVAISKAGKRSVPESRVVMPYHEKVDEPELKLPEMLDRAHSYMTSVIGYFSARVPEAAGVVIILMMEKVIGMVMRWSGDKAVGFRHLLLCVMQPKRAKWRIFTVQWMI